MDLISRQAAIDGKISIQRTNGVEMYSDEAVPVEYLKALPSAQPESCDGCKWEYAFGYGECHHCKRSFNDMYKRGEQNGRINSIN